jgi:4-hydroxy-tetrahydrodipicolinate reductase
MGPINVVINGVLGKMGREVLATACREADLVPVGGADIKAERGTYPLPDGFATIPVSDKLNDVLGNADVVVDFTGAEGAMTAIRVASARKVNVVIGSTGLSDADVKEAEGLSREHKVGMVIAPNFALGAVLMIHLARVSARFFDYAELTDMHHEAKIDAPSGTALAIARAAAEGKGGAFVGPKAEKETLPGTRGGDYQGLNVHSSRMPGRMAHHELVFGTLGQTLTIRHDSINRESFMPGVVLAIREAVKAPVFTYGLEKVLGL